MHHTKIQNQAQIEFTTRLTRAILYLASDRLCHLRSMNNTTAFVHPHTINTIEALEKQAFSARGASLVEIQNRRYPWWMLWWGSWKENSSEESEQLLKQVMVWFSERFEGMDWEEVEMLEENREIWGESLTKICSSQEESSRLLEP